MASDLWREIADHYRMATECLCCPRQAVNWHRQEDKGRYHLWRAYYEALTAEPKEDHLLYARILMMMSREHFYVSDYEKFHKFIEPAKEAFDNATANGQTAAAWELAEAARDYECLKYVLKKTDNTAEQDMDAYACVEGLNAVEDFCFHDSKPVHFEHQENRALLKLDYYGLCVTFEFTGLTDIQVEGDPTANWIQDFYCYPLFHDREYFFFDIGYYQITANHIRVIDVQRET